MFRKSPVNAYLRVNKWLWNHLPLSLTTLRPFRSYGSFLHGLVRLTAARRQFHGTFFCRNRPELELIRRLADQKGKGSVLKIGFLGCSNGAEVYSVLWTIRSARPDLKVIAHAVDISEKVLDLAKQGVYSLKAPELVDEPIFKRMTEEEMEHLFDKEGDDVRIKSWLKEGITWHHADAGDQEIANVFGRQDMVVANNFLCHMEHQYAEACLRNIARLVNTGGYLFVRGIDLDVRTKVARDLAWRPVQEMIEDIHDGDPSLRTDWPWEYWGLEPFDRRRPDWRIRYSSVFQTVALYPLSPPLQVLVKSAAEE